MTAPMPDLSPEEATAVVRWLCREPAVIAGFVLACVVEVAARVVSGGWSGWAGLGPLVCGVAVRFLVYAPATVARLKREG